MRAELIAALCSRIGQTGEKYIGYSCQWKAEQFVAEISVFLFKNVQVDDVYPNVGTKQKLPRDAVSVPE